MAGYIFKRMLQIMLILIVFQSILFFLLQAQPGGIEYQFIANPDIPPEARQVIVERLGLDRPLGEQYLNYLKNFFIGNLGVSFTLYPRPVIDVIAERAPRTVLLFLTATVVSFYTGFVLGKILAWQRGGLLEYGVTLGGSFLYTVFTPWFALLLIWIFAFKLGLFPVGKFLDPVIWRDAPVDANHVFNRMLLTILAVSVLLLILYRLTRRPGLSLVGLILAAGALWTVSGLGAYALDIAHHLLLPTLSVTLVSFAGTMLLMRNSMLETIREDYILTARAKGISERAIRDRHAARNALLPVVTSLVLGLATVISGGIITETIFSWPGMGRLFYRSAQRVDYPLLMGIVMINAVLIIFFNLIADLAYAYMDPRVRYDRK
jgi:peptide/nickel transport system permease protein